MRLPLDEFASGLIAVRHARDDDGVDVDDLRCDVGTGGSVRGGLREGIVKARHLPPGRVARVLDLRGHIPEVVLS